MVIAAPPPSHREKPLTIGRALRQVPYFALLIAAYIIIVYVDQTALPAALFTVTLPSGGVWAFSVGDLILVIGLVCLFIEIVKATRTTRVSIADHALSMVTFIVALLLFLLVPRCATSTFFLIMMMSVIDVIAGFTVSLAGARRDIGME